MQFMAIKRVIILGASGSIGTQTIDVIQQSKGTAEELELVGFSLHSNCEMATRLHAEFPAAKSAWTGAQDKAPEKIDWIGSNALAQLLGNVDADIVVNAIAGAAGLTASILALRAGRNLALANKESIVMGYRLLKNSQMHNIVTSSLSILSMQHFSIGASFSKAQYCRTHYHCIRRAFPRIATCGPCPRDTGGCV